ncbi:MAG: YceI family protein [Actinomycetota bacterium]|nr:YceI family protein [Actinomycetota bacterium]
MTDRTWTLTAADGEVLIRTGVTGRAARLGHRLHIAVNSWWATVSWAGERPTVVEFSVDVDSLEVRGGEGGLKSLSGPEKFVARSNALKSLDAAKSPRILFHGTDIRAAEGGYRISGTLEIKARELPYALDLRVDDLGASWRMSSSAVIRQTEFGIKPYSLALGSIRVADDVTVSFTAERAKAS